MIEGLLDVITPKSQTHGSEGHVDDTIENVALAGAAAIQRLISDRDALRRSADDRQRELVALSAINEDLRRRITFIRHQYVELATKVLAQLEQFDQSTRDAMQGLQRAPAQTEDANLVALAHRLKPRNGPLKSETEQS